eukprot:SM000198S05335  [mRNA]  locus=s198:183443:184793:- [translate_table: standard]
MLLSPSLIGQFEPDDFKPASIDGGKPGRLVRSAGSDKVSVEFPTAAAAADGGSAAAVVAFEGRHEQCKELEGILFFDGAGFTLHRVHRAVKGLRVVRSAEKGGRRGTAPAAGPPPASSAGGGGGGGLGEVEVAELAAEDGGAGSAGADEAEDGGASPFVEPAEEIVNTGEDRPLQRLLAAGKEKRHQRLKDSAARATSSGLRAAPGVGGGSRTTADRSAKAAAHANGQQPKTAKAAAPVAMASALDPAKRAWTSIAEQIDFGTSAEAVVAAEDEEVEEEVVVEEVVEEEVEDSGDDGRSGSGRSPTPAVDAAAAARASMPGGGQSGSQGADGGNNTSSAESSSDSGSEEDEEDEEEDGSASSGDDI